MHHVLHKAAARPVRATAADEQAALRLLRPILDALPQAPCVRIGREASYTPPRPAGFGLHLDDPGIVVQLLLRRSPIVLADAYFRGALQVDGDLYQALSLKALPTQAWPRWPRLLARAGDLVRLLMRHPHGVGRAATNAPGVRTRDTDRQAIAFHYDVSNEFYGLWLDRERVYSCGYFKTPHDSLDAAQRNKLEHICRKLRLAPGERFLDIGCGWGALVCWAARHHGVRAHGITLSEQQLAYAQQRIRDEGLQGQVTVELRDYRDLPAGQTWDKVASVGMFEHVGLANLPTYHATVHRVLRPGGLFLNHGITHDEDGWNPTLAAEFINQYVFPNGELDRVSNVQLGMERTGFEILDVEGLRPHYALTLRHWVRRLEAEREAAERIAGPVAYRVWRLYMAGCALEFEEGGTGIYQILAARRGDGGRWPVPLTRADLYAPALSAPAAG